MAPDVFRKTMSREEYRRFIRKVLKALRGGLEETDGTIEDGKAAMSTSQTWQAIVWSILYPGKMYVSMNTINVNEGGVTITWYLKSSHDPLKGKILGNANKLSMEGLLALMFTAVLGDGTADVVKPRINGRVYDEAVIKIAMSDEKFKAWEPLLEELKSMGFRSGRPILNGNVVEARFHGSNAIDLARAMINVLPPILRDILDALAFEKWLNLRRIAEVEVRWRRGESQIEVAGYKFTVNVHRSTVELVRTVRDEAEAKKVIETLKAKYGDEFAKYVDINRSGKYLAVIIPMYVFEKYSDIKEQVVKVLCRKYNKVKDEKRRKEIIKALMRLTPTEGAAAADRCALVTT